jgi:NTE family protein
MKRALVVSGGGSKGAFAVGAIRHLRRVANVEFDIVVGTSTGALMSPLVVTDEIEELVRIYTSVKTKDIVKEKELVDLLTSTSFFDVQPLADLIKKELNDNRANQILQSPKQLFICTTCLQSGHVVYFHTGAKPAHQDEATEYRPLKSREDIMRAILASGDMPALMPAVSIPKGGPEQFVDGGVREIAPVKVAVNAGAEEIYAITLSPRRRKAKNHEFTRVVDVLGRTIDLFTQEIVLNDLRNVQVLCDAVNWIEEFRQDLKTKAGLSETQITTAFDTKIANPFEGVRTRRIFPIRPAEEIEADTLEFDPHHMAQLVENGAAQAVVALADPVEQLRNLT